MPVSRLDYKRIPIGNDSQYVSKKPPPTTFIYSYKPLNAVEFKRNW